MAPNCAISLSNYKDAYKPGDAVVGAVTCNFHEPTTVRGIYITLTGIAKVSWKESHSKNSTTYYGEEEYFVAKIFLVNSTESETIELPSGEHYYPFEYNLPLNIPSTILHKHKYYKVTYKIKATVDRPWAIDYTDKFYYNIFKPIDLNTMPYLMEPAEQHYSKIPKICCLWQTGTLEVTIHLSKRGYIAGEKLSFRFDLKNNSSTNIDGIKMKLQQVIEYSSQKPSPRSRFDKETLTERRIEGLQAKMEGSYPLSLIIPRDLRVASLEPSQIIKLTYFLVIEAELMMHRNFKSKMPVVIGNIPFHG